MSEVGENACAAELAAEREFERAALHVATRCDVQLGADDLNIAVVLREQAAQEREVALVELNLHAYLIGQAVDLRSEPEILGDGSRDVGE